MPRREGIRQEGVLSVGSSREVGCGELMDKN